MGRYRKQVMAYAERPAGVVVQFAGMAGIYELARSNPGYDQFAPRLRSAKETGIPVAFEMEDHRILSVG